MSTLIITSGLSRGASAISSNIGLNSFPLIGGRLSGRFNRAVQGLGRPFGEKLDEKLFGSVDENIVRGSRLNDLTIQTSTYGDAIPLIYGRAKISGNIIWSSDIKETIQTRKVSSGGKGSGVGSATNKYETRYIYIKSLSR